MVFGGKLTIGESTHVSSRWSGRSGHAPVSNTRPWLRRYVGALAVIDVVAVCVAACVAYIVRFSNRIYSSGLDATLARPATHGYLWYSLGLPVVWIALLGLLRAYDDRVVGFGSEEFARVGQAVVALTATVAFYSYATKAEVARGYVLLAVPLTAALCLLGRYGARKVLHRRRMFGGCMSNVLAVGGEHSVADLVTQLRREPYGGLRVVGACVSSGSGGRLGELCVPVLGGISDVVRAVERLGADTVAVTSSAEISPARLRRLAWDLERTDTALIVAPGLMEVAGPRLHIRPVIGLPLLHVEEPEFRGIRRMIKAVVDRIGALFGLLLIAPVFLSIATLIKLTSPGPVFFRQIRTGKDGRPFAMIKFRTMVVDAEARLQELLAANERSEGLLFKIRDDPRVTRVGRVLRKYSLDELPQLINVLTGSMSLVGPRPPLPSEVEQYDDDVRRRLLVKPGLTGLWQISGRSDLTWDEAVRLDLRYVENWSLTVDIMILWKTLSAVIRGSGAY